MQLCKIPTPSRGSSSRSRGWRLCDFPAERGGPACPSPRHARGFRSHPRNRADARPRLWRYPLRQEPAHLPPVGGGGVRFVQCQAEFRLRPETGVTSNWDDHSVNSHIFNAYREKLPSFDQAVSGLIEDLYVRGPRSARPIHFLRRVWPHPKNLQPGSEWPAGAGSLGQSDERFPVRRRPEDGSGHRRDERQGRRTEPNAGWTATVLLATIYRRFGIDTSRNFSDNSGQPDPVCLTLRMF